MVAMAPSSFRVMATSTGPPKPWAVAVRPSAVWAAGSPVSAAVSAVSAGSASWAGSTPNRLFSASITAVLVTVAPVMASTPFSP